MPALSEPGESTQPLALTTDRSEPSVTRSGEAGAPRRPRRRWLLVAVLVVVAVAVGLVLLQLSGGPAPARGGTDVPAEVPERFQQPLQELHDAIEEPR